MSVVPTERAEGEEAGHGQEIGALDGRRTGRILRRRCGSRLLQLGDRIPQATTAADGGLTIPLKPVVKHRTVVIHKKAPSPPAGSVVVLTPAAPAQTQAVVTSSGSHSASGSENESGGDD